MIDYKQYRWFFTSNDVLVVGGKSAEQNDELLEKVIDNDYVVMHTSHPGSPFCVLISDKVAQSDIDECAVFCGCYSRAWKERKKKTKVDIFDTSKLYKTSRMKAGTWGVKGKTETVTVPMELGIVKQKGVYRGVPPTVGESLAIVHPGKIDKTKQLDKLRKVLGDEKVSNDELLAALPPGGLQISV